jgi:hypothetical protein
VKVCGWLVVAAVVREAAAMELGAVALHNPARVSPPAGTLSGVAGIMAARSRSSQLGALLCFPPSLRIGTGTVTHTSS